MPAKPPHLLRDPRLQFICAISMIGMVAMQIVAPVLPALQRAFDIGPESVGLVMAMFTLPGVFFIPIVGLLADRYGRRTVLVPLILLFSIAGGLCAFSPDYPTFLALRFLSGIGAGGIASLSLVLVGDTYEGAERSAAFGYRIAIGQVGNGIVPLIAGALALVSWQAPFLLFFLGAPLGLVALKMMDTSRPDSGASLVVYLRQVAAGLSSGRAAVLMCFIFGLTAVTHAVNSTYLPIFMENAFGASALVIGFVLSARVAAAAVIASNIRWINTRVGDEMLLVIALVALAVALAIIPFSPNVWLMVIPAVIAGVTTGVGFPAFHSLLVASATKETLAGFTAANSVVARIGQTVGPLIAGGVLTLGGIDSIFFTGAFVSLALLAIVLFGPIRGGRNRRK